MIKQDYVIPELYLFLSADIIDSTQLKYSKENIKKQHYWYNCFLRFYEDFPIQLENRINSLLKDFHLKTRIKLVIWKYIGDELLFYIKIKRENEVPCIIKAFEKTLSEWYTIKENKYTKLKGCAWIGQFPFIDRRIVTDNNQLDFLGTSIDCGFRLGKYASENLIILSIEVVDLCLKSKFSNLGIVYLKTEKLKGVLDNFNYPIFALIFSTIKSDEHKYLYQKDEGNIESYINKYYEKLSKKYAETISRIDSNIKNYLDSKIELSKNIIDKTNSIKTEMQLEEALNKNNTAKKDYINYIDKYKIKTKE